MSVLPVSRAGIKRICAGLLSHMQQAESPSLEQGRHKGKVSLRQEQMRFEAIEVAAIRCSRQRLRCYFPVPALSLEPQLAQ